MENYNQKMQKPYNWLINTGEDKKIAKIMKVVKNY